MLRIRSEQMRAFELLSRDRFIEKVCGLIRDQHADLAEGLADDALRAAIAKALDDARTYRLVVEADVYEFSVLRLLFGADWPRQPEYRWAQNILNDVSQAPDVRLFQIREHLQLQAETENESTDSLLKAITVLNQMNALVFQNDKPNKPAWECALLTVVRDQIKSGNFSVAICFNCS